MSNHKRKSMDFLNKKKRLLAFALFMFVASFVVQTCQAGQGCQHSESDLTAELSVDFQSLWSKKYNRAMWCVVDVEDNQLADIFQKHSDEYDADDESGTPGFGESVE